MCKDKNTTQNKETCDCCNQSMPETDHMNEIVIRHRTAPLVKTMNEIQRELGGITSVLMFARNELNRIGLEPEIKEHIENSIAVYESMHERYSCAVANLSEAITDIYTVESTKKIYGAKDNESFLEAFGFMNVDDEYDDDYDDYDDDDDDDDAVNIKN